MINKQLVIQFIKFIFVGLLNTLISYGVYFVCLFWSAIYISNILKWIIGIINAFFWNNFFIFKFYNWSYS